MMMSSLTSMTATSASSTQRRNNEQQHVFTRQATILRKNLFEWDHMLRNPRGEAWPTMVGRLNAALNQSGTLDRSIDDVLEHFVYLPKQSPVNPQDIPFFLSTRLDDEKVKKKQQRKRKRKYSKKKSSNENDGGGKIGDDDNNDDNDDDNDDDDDDDDDGKHMDDTDDEDITTQVLSKYEQRAAQIAQDFEDAVVRF